MSRLQLSELTALKTLDSKEKGHSGTVRPKRSFYFNGSGKLPIAFARSHVPVLVVCYPSSETICHNAAWGTPNMVHK